MEAVASAACLFVCLFTFLPAFEEMLTMCPFFLSSIPGSTAPMQFITPCSQLHNHVTKLGAFSRAWHRLHYLRQILIGPMHCLLCQCHDSESLELALWHSVLCLCFKTSSPEKTFHIRWVWFTMNLWAERIFTWMVSDEDSFWYRGKRQFRNDLLKYSSYEVFCKNFTPALFNPTKLDFSQGTKNSNHVHRYKYMLFAGWEVRIVKNCDRGHSFSLYGPT